MTVRVLLFGHYRDILASETTLTLPEGATVADVAQSLVMRDARLSDLLNRTRVAVAEEFATPETLLNDGDEVAFLPPMSGG